MDLPKIGKLAPIFKGQAIINNKVCDISSSDFNDKYLVLLFFPMDFAFVCPTELIAFNDQMDEFAKINACIIACAPETHLTHLKWLTMPQKDGGIRGVRIPLIADKSMKITKDFGVLNEDEGIAYRAMFIIDNKGILRQITINDRLVGRNAIETRRIITALQDAGISQECTPKTGSKRRGSSNAEKPHALLRLERTLAHELVE